MIGSVLKVNDENRHFCLLRRLTNERYDLLQDVRVVQLVHQLDLLEHVVPVGPLLVHLQDHHLPGVLVDHLKQGRDG